jgi:branched-chain amino acid transport system permease protein
LVAWFLRSRLGIAMRATAFDQEAAQAQGINVGRIFAVAWAIGAALAAVAGIFSSVAPRAAGITNATAFVVFRAFPAIIIGGLDSVVGAVVGGFLVGIAEVVIGTYSAGFSNVIGVGFGLIVPYLLMLIFLLFRPYGLFGTEEIRRV